jgi:hypothetical protein
MVSMDTIFHSLPTCLPSLENYKKIEKKNENSKLNPLDPLSQTWPRTCKPTFVLGLRRLEKEDQVPNGGGWNSCSFHPTFFPLSCSFLVGAIITLLFLAWHAKQWKKRGEKQASYFCPFKKNSSSCFLDNKSCKHVSLW